MRSIFLAFLLALMCGTSSAQEISSRAKSLKEAMDISKANPKKHVLVYYKNYRTWGSCRYIDGVLSVGEIKKLYQDDFILLVANIPTQYSENHELRVLANGARYTPNFVFLDNEGKEVLRTPGFGNPHEAKILHKFVSSRAYKSSSYSEFLSANSSN